MKAIARRYRSLVSLAMLLVATVPIIFTGCGGGMILPADSLQHGSGPVILSMTPASGPQAGGTKVIINGSNFTSSTQQGPPTITFGGVQATHVSVVSPTQVVVMTPSHPAGPVPVEVTNSSGESTSSTGDFTYTATSLAINSVTPNSGPTTGGTTVTVAGTGFAGGAAVSFGGTAASGVSVVSATRITAIAPAHAAGAVTLGVVNPDGSHGSLAGAFTYSTSPSVTVSSVTPNSGPTTGGTTVTVVGSGFANGAAVSFGGTAASGVSVVSATQITATAPAHAAGAVTLAVVNPDSSQGSLADAFTYSTSPSVTVSSLTPNSGPTTGGTTVLIGGSGFASGAAVSFGGSAGTAVSVLSATQIRATSPAHAAAAVTVTVANPDGSQGSLAGGFTFTTSSKVTVSGATPNSGPTTGGTTVTVTGSGFVSGATVSFGGTAGTGVSVLSATQVKATSPAHAAGAVSIAVTNPDGSQGSLASAFTYSSSSTVQVSSVTPNSGPTSGGTSVTVAGSGFASGAAVSFGGTAGTGISVLSATQVKATVPAHAAGAVTVTVANPDGSQGSLAAGFTYGSSNLTIAGVSPISGAAAGGTQVTLTGTNFLSGASVTFGGLAATSITVSNSTTILATTPAHSSGSVAVTVTNTDGTSTTLNAGYAFHSVDLNWSAPSSSSVTISGYNVYRAQASSGPFVNLNGSSPVTGTSYSDDTVEGGTTYYYEVKSVDSNGVESPPAGPVQVATSP